MSWTFRKVEYYVTRSRIGWRVRCRGMSVRGRFWRWPWRKINSRNNLRKGA